MNEEMDFELAQQLNVLRSQPARDPAKAAQGRAAFLAQAQALANSLPLPITNREQVRHIGWMHPLQSILKFQRKEQSPMFGALGTILLIVSLVLGGSGVTVAAAQNSQPDQVLYPVKTWSEDVRVQMNSNTQSRLELALEYSQRRAEEMQRMLKAGQVPPDAVQARMQAEIDLALRLAAGQPDGEALKLLAQIRARLLEQAGLLEQTPLSPLSGFNMNAQAAAILDRTRAMLQDRLHLCDLGLQDPAVLRDQLREQDHDRLHGGALAPATQVTNSAGNPWTTGTPTPGSGYGPGPGTSTTGGDNPWTAGTPTPGAGYGPGPGTNAGTVSGGNDPWATSSPTPGSSYGPGPRSGAGIGSGGTGNGGSDGGTGGSGNNTAGGSGAGSGADYGGAGTEGSSSGAGIGSGCGSCDGSGAGSGDHGEGGPGGHH